MSYFASFFEAKKKSKDSASIKRLNWKHIIIKSQRI